MKTVLIVDDSPIVLETTGATLTNAGYRVVLRARAEGTVAAILKERPDLVLLDVNMPHLSGETIAVILAKADPTRRTLVLLHSSLPADQLKQKSQEVGAHGYISKGGRPLDLVNQVTRWLPRDPGSSSQHRRVVLDPLPVMETSPPAPRQPPVSAPVSAPVRKLVPDVLCVDDDHFTLSLFRRALQAEPMNVSLADTGGRALQRVLSDDPPDVIVCDLTMPDTDGLRVFERAVAHDVSWRRRFVFVADQSSVTRISKILSEGGVQVVYRPIDVGLLKFAVRNAVAEYEKMSGARVGP
jgi:CheY-like chemotaxis protein